MLLYMLFRAQITSLEWIKHALNSKKIILHNFIIKVTNLVLVFTSLPESITKQTQIKNKHLQS